MPNCPRGGRRRTEAAPAPVPECEPNVRRWPHPVEAGTARTDGALLQELRCALACQNQLLTDIRDLLEQLSGEKTQQKADS